MVNLNPADVENMVREILQDLLKETTQPVSGNKRRASSQAKTVTVADYPLGKKRPDLVQTPTGKGLNEITLQDAISDKIQAEDVRITSETLNMQAQIAEQVNRTQFAHNLRRAAELTAIPDQRVLEIYNAIRPYRSTKPELMAIADELEHTYNAQINAAFVRQAADVYEKRNRLRK
ncbi:diol dehydratase small subunit [Paradesulfitobacterium aromaticivorans]